MTVHKPVLLNETLEFLNLKKDAVVVDATLGGGGHGREIIKLIGDGGIYIGIDLDQTAISKFTQFPISPPEADQPPADNHQFPNNDQIPIFKFENQILINGNFVELDKYLRILKIEKVDAILADLGWSSDQVEDSERGMSFLLDAPLDMRLGKKQKLTAKEIVNEYDQEDLTKIISRFGEERYAASISKNIIKNRSKKEITSTLELVEIIRSAVPGKYSHGKIHPATRTFQALRIEVNKELENIENFIPAAIESLGVGGRLAIISFHSLEDRIVKQIFAENARGCICPPELPKCACGKVPIVKIVTKKPVTPGEAEISGNPRARSAKLRVCEKIHPME